MSKIIPILSLIISACLTVLAASGLITVSLTIKISQLRIVSIPTAIVGLTLSTLCAPLAFLFKRDKLCGIAFGLDIASLVLSAVSVTIWIVAL